MLLFFNLNYGSHFWVNQNLLYEHFKIIAPLRNMILDQLSVISVHLLTSSSHAVIHEQSGILLVSVLIKHPMSFGHILSVPLIV